MDPVERIKSILDGLTQPLYKDDPFGTAGRKAVFDGSSSEAESLSFQGFINRVNTFKPEHWGSDPNAAVYLAKYGFKTTSSSKVCCCSCHIEVDMGVFLGKADILQTIAAKSHKKSCRWLRVTTPGVYFKIPSNPHRTLENFKITFREMMSVGPALPVIQKKTFVGMGLSEDFVNEVLSSFDSPFTEALASALILSLCGWVKSTDTSLQCNFCQRVVGTWNFFSVCKDQLDVSPPIKKRRIISLLYNEIRRDMIQSDQVEDAESEKMDEDPPPETIQEPIEQLQNESNDAEQECNNEEADEVECSSKENSVGIPLSVYAHMLKRKALKYLRCKSERKERYFSKMLKIKMQKRVEKYLNKDLPADQTEDHRHASESDAGEDKTEMDNDSKELCGVSNNSVSDSTVNNQLQLDSGCNNNGASSDKNGFYAMEHGNSEESCVPIIQSCVSSCDLNLFENDQCDVSEDPNEVQSSSNANDSADPDLHTDSTVLEEVKCSPCLNEKSKKCISQDDCDTQMELTKCEEFEKHNSLNNVCESPLNRSSQSEMSCDLSTLCHEESLALSEGRKKRKRVPECERNGTSYDTDLLPRLPAQLEPAHFTRSKKKELELLLNERTKPKLESKNGNRENVVNSQTSEDGVVDHQISEDDIADRENIADGKISEDCIADRENVADREISEDGIVTSRKNVVDGQIAEDGIEDDVVETTLIEQGVRNPMYNDLVNAATHDTENTGQNSLILNNHDDENTELTLVISSVRGNAVIPMDTSEEDDGENDCTHDKDEFTGDATIVSSQNEFQDYVADEERNLENGFAATHHASSSETFENECDTSSYDNSKKIAQENVSAASVVMSHEAKDIEKEYDDNLQAPGHKRKREETDESNNHVIKKPNIEELNIDLCKSYFHPELEHRFWCIWRIKLADYVGTSRNQMKGWERHAETIKKGLKPANSEKISLREAECKTLSYIADILAIPRSRK